MGLQKGFHGGNDRHPAKRRFQSFDVLFRGRESGDAADRFTLKGDGVRLAGDGTAAPQVLPSLAANRPATSGWQTTPLESCSTQITMTSQLLVASLFQAEQTFTVNNLTVATGATAAGATPTLIQFALYSISGTTATLIANTTNATGILNAVGTSYAQAVAVPTLVSKGASYYFAALVVTAATAPTVIARSGGNQTSTIWDAVYGSGLRLGGSIAAQASLPATFTTTNLVSSTTANSIWGWLT